MRYTEEQIAQMVQERRKLQPDEFLNLAQERSKLRSRLDVLAPGVPVVEHKLRRNSTS